MSIGFDILISPSAFEVTPLEFYERLLDVVLGSSHVRHVGLQLTVYRRQGPFELGPESKDPNIAVNETFDRIITAQQVRKIVEEVPENDLYVNASLTYDRLRWNNDKCDSEPSAGWLEVEYESTNFADGHRHKRSGPFRIHFDERKFFTSRVVDFSRCPAENSPFSIKYDEYLENIRFVERLFRNLAEMVECKHLIIVTEGTRVNPVDFHMVYHNQVAGYLFDIERILRLHNYGGGYFYDGRADTYDAPYSSLPSSGPVYSDWIRSIQQAQRLEQQLEYYCTVLNPTDIGRIMLSEEVVLDAANSSGIEAGVIGDGLYVASSDFLFGYIDPFYLRLLDRIASTHMASSN